MPESVGSGNGSSEEDLSGGAGSETDSSAQGDEPIDWRFEPQYISLGCVQPTALHLSEGPKPRKRESYT